MGFKAEMRQKIATPPGVAEVSKCLTFYSKLRPKCTNKAIWHISATFLPQNLDTSTPFDTPATPQSVEVKNSVYQGF